MTDFPRSTLCVGAGITDAEIINTNLVRFRATDRSTSRVGAQTIETGLGCRACHVGTTEYALPFSAETVFSAIYAGAGVIFTPTRSTSLTIGTTKASTVVRATFASMTSFALAAGDISA